MRYTLMLLTLGIILIIIPLNKSQPNFNGTTPGCDDSGCHNLQDGIVSATVSDLDVLITVSGTSSKVAGELVDENGTVVAVNNSTSNNPFTLTATGPGTYRVNAGFKNPSRKWDSVMVDLIVTNVGENTTTPTSYKLYNNFPNPFNPSTTLKYSIPEASFTTLKVFNAVGSVVATLVNELKSAGTYEVEFNASNLASGIYYYTLSAGNFTQTKKMLLLK
jgi:Secretion system C-terminal sorting domain